MAPVAVNQLGYRTVFVTFGLIAIPASLTCFGVDDGSSNDTGGWPVHESGQSIILEESDGTMCSPDSVSTSGSYADLMEGKV